MRCLRKLFGYGLRVGFMIILIVLLYFVRLSLNEVPAQVNAVITADQSYCLWVNGLPMSLGVPRVGFHDSWPYDELDIAPFLQEGDNVLRFAPLIQGAVVLFTAVKDLRACSLVSRLMSLVS